MEKGKEYCLYSKNRGEIVMDYTIRPVRKEEAGVLAEIEAACFPAAEAASREEIGKRLAAFPENFLAAQVQGVLVGFINGGTTDKPYLPDELYHDTGLHRPQGKWQTVFGLNVLPQYRRQGIAARLLDDFAALAKQRGKEGVILTCKDHMVAYYERRGFVRYGMADSCHGGAKWHDMRLVFDDGEKTALKDLAEKYYKTGYNCAESVVHAGNEYYGLGLCEHDMRMMAAFGGGMQVGDVCGALTGAACVVSAKYIETKAHDQKEELHAVMVKLVKAFQARLGARQCAKIKAQFYKKDGKCVNTVIAAAEVLAGVISEFDEEQNAKKRQESNQ